MTTKVFIVDDAEVARDLIRILLMGTQYEVVGEASTLLGALQKLARLTPDMIILDLDLPDGNGINLIPRVREMHDDVAFVVVSAHHDASSVHTALQMGAHGYLIKPFTADGLETALAQAWRRSGKRQRISKPA